MTDKVQKIREEVERLKEWQPIASPSLNKLLSFIDSLQEEPVSERFAFKAIPRLLEMIEPTDRSKSYVAKLADAFDSEGYYTDAKIVRESLKIMNGEKVAMATMDEEPVSEKKCMFTKENYTDEDRMVLCEDCKERCEYSKKEEPVSGELNEAAIDYAESVDYRGFPNAPWNFVQDVFKAGAEWQKSNLWKPADGDDLPEIDREVVVFTQIFPDDAGIMSVSIAHRPNPNGWDGKSLASGKIEHYTPKTYDKGGWNIPDVKFWLDVELPKEIEL